MSLSVNRTVSESNLSTLCFQIFWQGSRLSLHLITRVRRFGSWSCTNHLLTIVIVVTPSVINGLARCCHVISELNIPPMSFHCFQSSSLLKDHLGFTVSRHMPQCRHPICIGSPNLTPCIAARGDLYGNRIHSDGLTHSLRCYLDTESRPSDSCTDRSPYFPH